MTRHFGRRRDRGAHASGRDVMRQLASAAAAVRSQSGEYQQELERIEREARDDIRSRSEQLLRLAEHYLPAVTRETVDQSFAEVRGDLRNILTRKQSREAELQTGWDSALDRRQRLAGELDGVTAELDELVARREDLEEELAERLDGDELFGDLSRRAVRSERELELDLRRVAESKQEAADKLPAYERSRLFKYLVERGYGTPGYKKRGLTRRLDGWVARLVKFDKAKRSYDFLRMTPELMEAEVERRRAEFDELMDRVEEIQERHSDEIGLAEVLKEGMKIGKRRDALLTKIEGERQTQEGLERELDTLGTGDNEFYRQAVDRMRSFLGGLEESALEAKTRGTAETTDDAIFAEIEWLNRRVDDARRQAADLRRQQSGLGRQATGLEDLARRMRVAEYDSRRSVFPPGFDLRPEIEQFLKGELGKEALWSEIKQRQRFLPTWVEEQVRENRDLLDSDFSYLLMRVLAEAAGAAIRHATDSHHRRGGYRRRRRPSSVRRRARGGFTSGHGF